MVRVTVILVTVTLLVCQSAQGKQCTGDCNGDAAVTIDELVLAVTIALGMAPPGRCDAFDGRSTVEIGDVVEAVRHATDGCLPPTPESIGQVIEIRLDTPCPAWRVEIDEVWAVDDELWVISRVFATADICAAVIAGAYDSVEVVAPELPVRHFVVGATWHWDPGVTFLASRSDIGTDLLRGTIIYRRR